MAAQYAFLDAIDVKLYPAGTDVKTAGVPADDPVGTIVIDYLNESGLTIEADAMYARAKGVNAVAFNGAKTGQFTMNSELLSMEHLAMIMGGVYDEAANKISVNDQDNSVGYVMVGTFRGKKRGDNTMQKFQIICYNVAPQVNTDLQLSALDIGSFELVLDLLADEDGDLVEITQIV